MIGQNNPFNIRYAHINHWIGQIGNTRGFCDFVHVNYGIRAACILVMRSYRKQNICTISEIITKFAPPCENKTTKYVEYVCRVMSAFPFDVPRRDEFPALLCAMSVYEGNPVSVDEIKIVINEFNIKPYKCKK